MQFGSFKTVYVYSYNMRKKAKKVNKIEHVVLVW